MHLRSAFCEVERLTERSPYAPQFSVVGRLDVLCQSVSIASFARSYPEVQTLIMSTCFVAM